MREVGGEGLYVAAVFGFWMGRGWREFVGMCFDEFGVKMGWIGSVEVCGVQRSKELVDLVLAYGELGRMFTCSNSSLSHELWKLNLRVFRDHESGFSHALRLWMGCSSLLASLHICLVIEMWLDGDFENFRLIFRLIAVKRLLLIFSMVHSEFSM